MPEEFENEKVSIHEKMYMPDFKDESSWLILHLKLADAGWLSHPVES